MENCFLPARHTYFPRPVPRSTPPPSSKLVPIHFVDDKHPSAKFDRSAAAITIQKILRGFLVRKNMRTIKKIAEEAVEIRTQIEAVEIRKEAKERLRIGEMLMTLLLRLDAVHGVREYRRKVIRHVIQLQEAVDSSAQGGVVETLDSDKCTEASNVIDNTMISVADDDNIIITEEFDEASENHGEEIGESIENSTEEASVMAEPTPAGRAEDVLEMKDALNRTAAETETLRRMLGDLRERSMEQCELMSMLVQRVERLEGSMQRMERVRKNQAASPLDRKCVQKKQCTS